MSRVRTERSRTLGPAAPTTCCALPGMTLGGPRPTAGALTPSPSGRARPLGPESMAWGEEKRNISMTGPAAHHHRPASLPRPRARAGAVWAWAWAWSCSSGDPFANYAPKAVMGGLVERLLRFMIRPAHRSSFNLTTARLSDSQTMGLGSATPSFFAHLACIGASMAMIPPHRANWPLR